MVSLYLGILREAALALVTKFEKLDSERYQLHEEVEAKYAVFERDGKGFVQINTYGTTGREIPGKVSQSIQLDQRGAEQLTRILKQAFNL
jgi:hypothetical protein